ncbi:glycosyl transferase [Actinoplanes campanulatus]|nr:glycosyl transferase [Actinoplanes campanulatus]GID42218.1 glycosyl transferase [Actinoplanes campanulatus]
MNSGLDNLRDVTIAAPAPMTDPTTRDSDDPADPTTREPEARPASMWRAWKSHLAMALVSLAAAVYVCQGLWRAPYRHVVADNVSDQGQFEWMMSYGVYLLQHMNNPFFTTLLNAPRGVNLAMNTSSTFYAVVFAPLTHFAGPQVTFATILTLNLAGSAFVWYLFLRRWLVRSGLAAAFGGLLFGFSPGLVSHANGHLNWTSGWMVGIVAWWVLKLPEKGHRVRNGVVLGLLCTMGFSVAAEALFFCALACGLFLGVWVFSKPGLRAVKESAGRVLVSLGVTAVVAGALLSWPLYMHFNGPLKFTGTGFKMRFYSEDLVSYVAFPLRSVAGLFGWGADLAPNATEATSFLGAPLVLLVVVALGLLWKRSSPERRVTLRALAVVGLFFFLLSLGPRLRFMGEEHSDTPLLYALFVDVPLFDSALPVRYTLVVVAIFAIVLALLADEFFKRGPLARLTVGVLIVAALAPIAPLPLRTLERAPEPEFIASGKWQDYVTGDGVMTSLPLSIDVAVDSMRWQAYTMARGGDAQFRIPAGYFLGPQDYLETGRHLVGRVGAPDRPTDKLFYRAARWGQVPRITNLDRAQARIDFRYWKLQAIFLPAEVTGPKGPLNRDALLRLTTDLLGEPEQVQDVLVWRITPGVDPVDRTEED